MLAVLKLLLAILGLFLPGYLFARVLRIRWPLAIAFPFSALLLTELIILLDATNIPIRFGSMAALLGSWSVINLGLLVFQKKAADDIDAESTADLPKWLKTSCLVIPMVIVLAVAFRTTLYPLSGYDTYFRWEALARQILQYESLKHYPPVSAADYSIYLIPDGFPPLVASIYWWLYAAIGSPLMQLTSVSVILQLACAMALTFYGTSLAFGSRAAYFSLPAFSTATLLINSFAIGQDTGFTALAVAGQLCFAWAAVRKPNVSAVVTAALFASLGALARDYGPALSLAGLLVLLSQSQTRKYLPLFVSAVLILSAPWYLRNWAITGNPLFPHALPGGFPINSVFIAIHNSYNEIFSFHLYTATQWLRHLGTIFVGAPLIISGGIICGIIRWRDSAPMTLTAVVIMSMWLLSIGESPGGIDYSMRILAPAFVALSFLAGGAGDLLYGARWLSGTGFKSIILIVVMASCSLYAVAFCLAHPYPLKFIDSALFYRYDGPPEICSDSNELAVNLQASGLPATGVLTSNAYFATSLQRKTGFRPVMVWSPEASFVFDPQLSLDEIRSRLIENNIRLISFSLNSSNNPFLLRYGLFKNLSGEFAPEWLVLVDSVGDEALFQIR